MNKKKQRLASWIKEKKKKKAFGQGVFEEFFDGIFSINKSEKKKILSLLTKAGIESLLFYTDVKNLTHLLKNGITPLKNLKLKTDEIYCVWSFLQHDESIDLEFDTSSRAYFWKWINDLDFDPKDIAVIGINPSRLNQLTEKDWLLDQAQNLVNISEQIYVETFDWILIQNLQVYKETKKALQTEGISLDLYYGNDGIVRIQPWSKTKKTRPKTDLVTKLRAEEEKENG